MKKIFAAFSILALLVSTQLSSPASASNLVTDLVIPVIKYPVDMGMNIISTTTDTGIAHGTSVGDSLGGGLIGTTIGFPIGFGLGLVHGGVTTTVDSVHGLLTDTGSLVVQ